MKARVVLYLLTAFFGNGTLAAAPICLVPGNKQLFLDDCIISEMTGLQRTMHQPEKRGAVLKPDVPSDGSMLQIRSAPMWAEEEGVYKLIYTACTMDNHNEIGPALAVSKDGLHWEKPVLRQMEVAGSLENNRIELDPNRRWPRNAMDNIIVDPHDPDPSRRYKALIGAEGRVPAVSADAVHWQLLDVPTLQSSDESQLVYDPCKRRFLAMLKTGNQYGRAFSIAESEDFVHWTPNRFLFGADAEDQPLAKEIIRNYLADPALAKPLFVEPDPDSGYKPPAGNQPTWRAECYNIAVFPYEGLYIGMPQMFFPTGTDLPARNNTDGFHLIELAVTRDLVNWTRLGDRKPFIGPSPIDKGRPGVFDRIQLCVTNKPIEHGDELWFYYTGLKWRSSAYEQNPDGSPRDPATLSEDERADLREGWGAACLAVLRRDGFVSLDAGEQGGYVQTKPLKLAGSKLFLNVAAPQGEVTVEILDENGKPFPGFSKADAIPARGDAVRLPVRWANGDDLEKLAKKTISLRIHLVRASLYAFWTE